MIHQTQFFQKYAHYKQIRFHKFMKSFKKECLDDKEVFELANQMASCFGHINKDYEETLWFMENLVNHFNTICHYKEMKINSYVSKTWENNINRLPISYSEPDKSPIKISLVV